MCMERVPGRRCRCVSPRRKAPGGRCRCCRVGRWVPGTRGPRGTSRAPKRRGWRRRSPASVASGAAAAAQPLTWPSCRARASRSSHVDVTSVKRGGPFFPASFRSEGRKGVFERSCRAGGGLSLCRLVCCAQRPSKGAATKKWRGSFSKLADRGLVVQKQSRINPSLLSHMFLTVFEVSGNSHDSRDPASSRSPRSRLWPNFQSVLHALRSLDRPAEEGAYSSPKLLFGSRFRIAKRLPPAPRISPSGSNLLGETTLTRRVRKSSCLRGAIHFPQRAVVQARDRCGGLSGRGLI